MPSKCLFLFRLLTECKNSCWLPTIKRRKKANQLAESIEIRNANTSPIYRLPPELVLEIWRQLNAVDKRCLGSACRRYDLLLHSEKKVELGKYEREGFKERLMRDVEGERYFKLAEAERLSSATKADRLCSACRAPHPSRMFDATEMLRSPHRRKCHGAKLAFRMCSHDYLTYDEIKKHMPPGVYEVKWGHCSRLMRSSDNTWTCDGKSRKAVISGDGGLTMVEIQQHLKQLAQPVCPHLHTDGIFVQQSLQRDSRLPYYIPWATTGLSSSLPHTIFIDCFADNCETVLMICCHLRSISTYFTRELGTMTIPSDPRWRAQLEDRPVRTKRCINPYHVRDIRQYIPRPSSLRTGDGLDGDITPQL